MGPIRRMPHWIRCRKARVESRLPDGSSRRSAPSESQCPFERDHTGADVRLGEMINHERRTLRRTVRETACAAVNYVIGCSIRPDTSQCATSRCMHCAAK